MPPSFGQVALYSAGPDNFGKCTLLLQGAKRERREAAASAAVDKAGNKKARRAADSAEMDGGVDNDE